MKIKLVIDNLGANETLDAKVDKIAERVNKELEFPFDGTYKGRVTIQGNYIMVSLWKGKEWVSVGVAKRNPVDGFKLETGICLAVRRAMENA
jgi:hypothetical protein